MSGTDMAVAVLHPMISPPESEQELLDRARRLSGKRLSDLASEYGLTVPQSSVKSKGWTGTLLEAALGATAASLPEPDFQALGVELKTVPVSLRGQPRESTYVCAVPAAGTSPPHWAQSSVRRKLARVLWIPVVCDSSTRFTDRRIGAPLMWSPSEEEESALRADWEEFMDLICIGRIDDITARHGTILQIRPKAADAAARRRSVGRSGAPDETLPRGFYLRATFTAAVFSRHYARTL